MAVRQIVAHFHCFLAIRLRGCQQLGVSDVMETLTYFPSGRDGCGRHRAMNHSIMTSMPGSTDALVRVSMMQKSRTHGCVRIAISAARVTEYIAGQSG